MRFHISIIGFAVLLTINATVLWGGAFPFLPMDMQTWEVMTSFYLLQSISFWGTLLTNMLGAYYYPQLSRRVLVFFNGTPIFIGCCCLIATLYLPQFTMLLICIGALLLGAGCAGYLILLQRFFASTAPEQGNFFIIVGTALSAITYFLLSLVPIAVTFFIVPLILVPLSGLSIILSTREINFDQPMFEDIPRQNKHVYLNTIKGYWPSAACVGCLGFAAGVIRAVVLIDPSLGAVVNAMSMVGALLSSLVLLLLWRRSSFHLDVVSAFRVIFPFIGTSFLLLPFLGVYFMDVFAGALYMVFSFAVTIMMLQSAQASRDIGINPVFIYGFFAFVVYLMQSIGFLTGTFSDYLASLGYDQILVIALSAVWLLGLGLYTARGSVRDIYTLLKSSPSRVEFVRNRMQLGLDKPQTDSSFKSLGSSSAQYRDRVGKQCAVLQQQYPLTSREVEVMELIARGNSVAKIAERLIVSENTVRTHSKHIYNKLAIHKRAELLELLEGVG